METHRDTFGVAPLLAAIGEPVSTFYDRLDRKPSARAVAERIDPRAKSITPKALADTIARLLHSQLTYGPWEPWTAVDLLSAR